MLTKLGSLLSRRRRSATPQVKRAARAAIAEPLEDRKHFSVYSITGDASAGTITNGITGSTVLVYLETPSGEIPYSWSSVGSHQFLTGEALKIVIADMPYHYEVEATGLGGSTIDPHSTSYNPSNPGANVNFTLTDSAGVLSGSMESSPSPIGRVVEDNSTEQILITPAGLHSGVANPSGGGFGSVPWYDYAAVYNFSLSISIPTVTVDAMAPQTSSIAQTGFTVTESGGLGYAGTLHLKWIAEADNLLGTVVHTGSTINYNSSNYTAEIATASGVGTNTGYLYFYVTKTDNSIDWNRYATLNIANVSGQSYVCDMDYAEALCWVEDPMLSDSSLDVATAGSATTMNQGDTLEFYLHNSLGAVGITSAPDAYIGMSVDVGIIKVWSDAYKTNLIWDSSASLSWDNSDHSTSNIDDFYIEAIGQGTFHLTWQAYQGLGTPTSQSVYGPGIVIP